MLEGNLRRFDLNLLVALDALLRTRNVTRAGEQLSVTQSAMSGELRRLRQMFNDELLVRVGREYELTALAQDLIEPVGDILARIERTVAHQPSFDPATQRRRFSIVMSDYAMMVLLPPLLRRTAEEAPGMSVSVSPFNHQVATMLSYGGVDLVIGPAFDLGGVHSQSLFNDRSVCIVAADHPDVGDELSQELYESLPHLTVAWWPPLPFPSGSQTSGSDWSATQLAALLDPRPADGSAGNSDADVTTESFMMAPILVSESRLVALVPERLANAFKVLTPIRVLDPPAPVPKLEETMYWSAVADSDPAHEWLRKLIADVATGLE